MLSFNMPERRKSFRAHCGIVLEAQVYGPENYPLGKKTVMAKDINSNGVYFETEEDLPLNSVLNVFFRIPRSEKTINAELKVIRAEVLADDIKFGIAAVFTKLKRRDSEQINILLGRLNINKLLGLLIEREGSDLHLLADRPPFIRKFGEIEQLDWPHLTAEDIKYLLHGIMTKQQIRSFEKDKELDFCVQYDMSKKLRINVHQRQGFTEATLMLVN